MDAYWLRAGAAAALALAPHGAQKLEAEFRGWQQVKMRSSLLHPQRQGKGWSTCAGQPDSGMRPADLTPRFPSQVRQQQPAVCRLDCICRPLPRAAGARAGVAALARADCAAACGRTGASMMGDVALPKNPENHLRSRVQTVLRHAAEQARP